MKRILTIIIVIAFAVNSAWQACPYVLFSRKTVGGYALRPIATREKSDSALIKKLMSRDMRSLQQDDQRDENFEKYLDREGINRFRELHHIFTTEVKDALLDDPVLRPVFLQIIPDENFGEIVVNKEVDIDGIDVRKIISSNSIFNVGSPEVAAQVLKSGGDIVVGVTDRSSDKTFVRMYEVANGRQVYIPLPDGSWLGIKGSGQNDDLTKPTFYSRNIGGDATRWEGIAWEDLAKVAVKYAKIFHGSNARFTQILGYRRILAAPDGTGSLIDISDIRYENHENPILIFNRAATPHRLLKFPQIMDQDPLMNKLARRVSKGMAAMGYLQEGKTLTSEEMMRIISEEFGKQEAVKSNKNLHKKTMHSQDFTFAGEEMDNEELLSGEEYLLYHKHKIRKGKTPRGVRLYLDTGMSLEGILIKLNTMGMMVEESMKRLQSKMVEPGAPFPDPPAIMERFFRAYFRGLNDEMLLKWVETSGTKHSLAVEKIAKSGYLSAFYPDYIDSKTLKEDLMEIISKWAGEERAERVNSEYLSAWSIYFSDETLVPGLDTDIGMVLFHDDPKDFLFQMKTQMKSWREGVNTIILKNLTFSESVEIYQIAELIAATIQVKQYISIRATRTIKEALKNAAIWGNNNHENNTIVIKWQVKGYEIVVDVIDQGESAILFNEKKSAPENVYNRDKQNYGRRVAFKHTIMRYLDRAHIRGATYDFPLFDKNGERVGQILRMKIPNDLTYDDYDKRSIRSLSPNKIIIERARQADRTTPESELMHATMLEDQLKPTDDLLISELPKAEPMPYRELKAIYKLETSA